MSCPDGRPGALFEIDLGAAAGYWHPGGRGMRALPPDWAAPARTSLVQSAPAGALYDAAGTVLLAWAASDSVGELCVRCGVSEERKTFVVEVKAVRPRRSAIVIHLDASGGPLAPTVRRLARWLSTQCAGTPLPPPDVARLPVYSTWYTFSQEIDADLVEAEAALATKLGCGTVFIDDGWQQLGNGRGYQGCGDWLPDQQQISRPRGNRPCHQRFRCQRRALDRTAATGPREPSLRHAGTHGAPLGTHPQLPHSRPTPCRGARARRQDLSAARPGLRCGPAQDRLP